MSRRQYGVDLTAHHKLIVGEGESDRNFFAEFCWRNTIDGFDYAFAGMHNDKYTPSGFDVFESYLPAIVKLSGFQALTDLVLVCDSADDAAKRLTKLHAQIRKANKAIGKQVYSETPVANQVANTGVPRVHVLTLPMGAHGGLETVCFEVAVNALDGANQGGAEMAGWVNTFADSACVKWTTEKRDKLRLQALISAASKTKPDIHFSQLFDITGDHVIPLTSPAFGSVKNFLDSVAAL